MFTKTYKNTNKPKFHMIMYVQMHTSTSEVKNLYKVQTENIFCMM